MPGPPPKHPSVRARRNNPRKDFRELDSIGWAGEIPAWPLGADISRGARLDFLQDEIASAQVEMANAEDGRARGRIKQKLNRAQIEAAVLQLQIEQARDAEVALWDDMWRTPQAVMWAEARAHREVAQYVRFKIRAEQGDLDAAKEARMWSDRLGLNPLALLRLRVEVERADEAHSRGEERRGQTKPSTGASRTRRKKPGDDPRLYLTK